MESHTNLRTTTHNTPSSPSAPDQERHTLAGRTLEHQGRILTIIEGHLSIGPHTRG